MRSRSGKEKEQGERERYGKISKEFSCVIALGMTRFCYEILPVAKCTHGRVSTVQTNERTVWYLYEEREELRQVLPHLHEASSGECA